MPAEVSYNRYHKYGPDDLAGAWSAIADLAGKGGPSTADWDVGGFDAMGRVGAVEPGSDSDDVERYDVVKMPAIQQETVEVAEKADVGTGIDADAGVEQELADGVNGGAEEVISASQVLPESQVRVAARGIKGVHRVANSVSARPVSGGVRSPVAGGARVPIEKMLKADGVAEELLPEPETPEREVLEGNVSREGRIAELRERLRSRPSFRKMVGQMIVGVFEWAQRVARDDDQKGVMTEEVVVSETVKKPVNSNKDLEVDPEGKVESLAKATLNIREDERVVSGATERELEQQYKYEQDQRQNNLAKLRELKTKMDERMWNTQNSALQERFAQVSDALAKKILMVKAAIGEAAQREANRRRSLTEMEEHGQFALAYLKQNGIFDGPYDRDGLEALEKLEEDVEAEVIWDAVKDREEAGAEHMVQLEYIRPAIRELKRMVEHPDDWKDMRIQGLGGVALAA